VFVHISAVERRSGTLREGQKISYEIVQIAVLANLRPTICAPPGKLMPDRIATASRRSLLNN
jgi:hypothetical protein